MDYDEDVFTCIQTRNIGIGISKRKCVVCVMDDKGRIQEETAYDNNPLSSSIMFRVSNIT